MHPDDPHYFAGLEGRAVFLLGHDDVYGCLTNLVSKADAMYQERSLSLAWMGRKSTTTRPTAATPRIALTHRTHWFSYSEYFPPRDAPCLGKCSRLVSLLQADRDGSSIEHLLPQMRLYQPNASGGHALTCKTGRTATWSSPTRADPTLTVTSAGLTFLRHYTQTGVEVVVGTTTAGANVLSGTDNDTARWTE